MAKDAYYFSHDSNARNDEKILSLRMKLGMEGYGIYWAIIEMLRDSTDYRMQTQCERIAFELHTDSERVKSVIHDFDLFGNDDEYFWSESLLRRMEIKEKKSNKARESAKARWDKTNAIRTHSECNTSKGKEKKESKIKETGDTDLNNDSGSEVEIWPTFEDFWTAYNKKVGSKEKCKKKFDKLKQDTKEIIMNHIFMYVKATPDKQYRLNPETFFNQKAWENEIIQQNGKGQTNQDKEQYNRLMSNLNRESNSQ